MTPKEKAEELVTELFERSLAYHDACIAAKYLVNAIINEYEIEICYCGYDNDWEMWNARQDYWQQVKEEIKKL